MSHPPSDLKDAAQKRLLLQELLRQQQQNKVLPVRPVTPRANPDEPPPLSFAQERLWFLEQLEPGTATHNVPQAARLKGPLRPEVLEQAITELSRRHEALRASFRAVGGRPVQMISPVTPVTLPITDLTALSEAAQQAEVQRRVDADAAVPFELAKGPLMRTSLLKLGPEEWVLLWCMHHIITDGQSAAQLMGDLAELYESFAAGRPSALPPAQLQYADFAEWQREWLSGDVAQKQLGFWKDRLEGLPPLELWGDRAPPPVQSMEGDDLQFTLPPSVLQAATALAQREGATLFMVLEAGLHALVHRYTGQEDFAIGTVMASRNRPETTSLVGPFVNPLVLRTRTSGDVPFAALVREVKKTTLEAYGNSDLPFERLVEHLQPERDLSRSPFFQVMFELQGAPFAARWAGISVEPIFPRLRVARVELSLLLWPEGGGLRGRAEFSTRLFDPSTIERFVTHLRTLLEDACAHPEKPLRSLSLLQEEERRQILETWNETAREYPADQTFEALFLQQVDRTPASVAVEMDGVQLSYSELAERAQGLAAALVARGVGPGDLVALLGRRSPELLAAILGTFLAGAAYVPLDPQHPKARLADVIARSGARGVLVGEGFSELAAEALSGVDAAARPWVLGMEASASPQGPLPEAQPSDLAYVIFTSGSTGVPKGAMVERRGMVNHLYAKLRDLQLAASDVVAQTASQCFDISVWQFLSALLAGGRTQIFDEDTVRSPRELLTQTERCGVTVLEIVPSMLRAVLDLQDDERPALSRLWWLVVTGEALPGPLVGRWHEQYPSIPILNAYGPTECSDDVTHALFREGCDRPVAPLGRPLHNTRLYVLDPHGAPVPIGVAGEIHVGGDGVGRGYVGDPERTAASFIPDRFSSRQGDRLYRTGDRGRWLPDGQLEFLGRIDFQVKLRGHRIELGEIETALEKCPGVSHAAAAVVEITGGPALVGYVVAPGGLKLASSALREQLGKILPEYMIPAVILQLPELPLSSNGKVDRKRLPVPDRLEERGDKVPPRNPFEELVAAAMAEVLGIRGIGAFDDFFALGGHSLLATRLATRLRELTGHEIPLRAIFEAPTVARLAEVVQEQRSGGQRKEIPPLVSIPRDPPPPASYAQERLWFLDQLYPGSSGFNSLHSISVSGPLERERLQRVLTRIVERHEVLRTRLVERDGHPLQTFDAPWDVALPLVDLGTRSRADRDRALQDVVDHELNAPFDFTRDRLLRAQLLRLAEDEHVLLITAHHAVSDGVTGLVILEELEALYAAELGDQPAPPAPALHYADFSAWQRQWLESPWVKAQIDYWRTQLSDAPEVLSLRPDRPRQRGAAGNGMGGVTSVSLSPALSRSIKTLGQTLGVTPVMFFEAVFAALLYRFGGDDDVCIGMPISGRNWSEIERMMGMFVNIVVLRARIDGAAPFRSLLGHVREQALGAYSNSDVPFDRVVEAVRPNRSLDYTPLFQAAYDFQAFVPSPGKTRFGPFEVPASRQATIADVYLRVQELEHHVDVRILFNPDLFDERTIQRMLESYVKLLEGVVASPETAVDALPLATDTERAQLQAWNQTAQDYPRDATFEALFLEQVAKAPDAVAVVQDGRGWTYAELAARAGGVAASLAQHGVGPGDVVALLSERDPDLLAAILGTFLAGAAYLPLDPHHPPARLAEVLGRSGAKVALVGEPLAPRLDEAYAKLTPDRRPAKLPLQPPAPAAPPPPRARPGDLAYVIFTSGSTGVPKGVMVERRGMLNHLFAKVRDLSLTSREVVAETASACFDISVWQFLSALVVGGRTWIASDELTRDPEGLLSQVEAAGVTVLEVVPSMMRAMLGLPGERRPKLSALRWMVATGEALPGELCGLWNAAYPKARLLNAYGPTECSDDVTHAVLDGPCALPVAPIGRPLQNTQIHVLGPDGLPTPVGVPGELCVGGEGVGRGYLGDPEKTAQAFVPDPFSSTPGARLYRTGDLARWLPDGQLEFLGRLDAQVKVRGHRIELGEVEVALKRLSGVGQAVVVLRELPGGAGLVAYVVPPPGGRVEPHALREQLRVTLPEYMVPAFVVPLDALPLTSNGKIDRKKLPAPTADASAELEQVAPRNHVEEWLIQIWSRVLGQTVASVDANFFEIGGHSLLLAALVQEIDRAVGVRLRLIDVLEAQTIAAQAELLQRSLSQERPKGATQTPSLQRLREGSGTPVVFVHPLLGDSLAYALLARHLRPGAPVYALEAPELHGERPFASVEARAAAYVQTLRAAVPQGPYRLFGYSSGGAIAWAMAAQLRAAGQAVETVGLLDTNPTFDRLALPALRDGALRDDDALAAFVESWVEAPVRKRLEALGGEKRRSATFEHLRTMTALPRGAAEEDVLRVVRTMVGTTENLAAWSLPRVDVRVDLFLADGSASATQDLAQGWRQVAPTVTVHPVPGDHRTMLAHPQIVSLAAALDGCLSALDAANGAAPRC